MKKGLLEDKTIKSQNKCHYVKNKTDMLHDKTVVNFLLA
jgi:hypothetical protein